MRTRAIKYLLLFFILNSTFQVFAQKNFKYYDSLTYQLYLQQRWKDLLKSGQEAVDNNFDYYYMRTRMGIAAAELDKYFLAEKQFKNALKFYSNDTFALKQLVIANLNAGKPLEAKYYFSKLPKKQKANNKLLKPKNFESITFESGYAPTNSLSKNETIDFNGPENILGVFDTYRNTLFFTLGANNIIGKRWNIFWSLQQQLFQKTNIFHYTFIKEDSIKRWGQTGYTKTYTPVDTKDYFEYTDKQQQFYVRTKYLLTPTSSLIVAYHHVATSQTTKEPIIKTEFYYPAPSVTAIKQVITYRLSEETISQQIIVGGFEKRWTYAMAALQYSQIKIGNKAKSQADVGVTIFPKANYNLYFNTNLAITKRKQQRPTPNIKEIIGFSLGKKAYALGYFAIGEMENFTTQDGYVFYNSTDLITQLAGFEAHFLPNPKLDILLGLEQNQYTSSFEHYISPTSSINHTIYYQILIFRGGIQWKF